jgi:hypothetical protein
VITRRERLYAAVCGRRRDTMFDQFAVVRRRSRERPDHAPIWRYPSTRVDGVTVGRDHNVMGARVAFA